MNVRLVLRSVIGLTPFESQNVTQMTVAGSHKQMDARREFYEHMMSILTKKPWIAEYCTSRRTW